MAAAIAILLISCGALVAGVGHVRTARRMRAYATTRGAVIARSVVAVRGGTREARWGQGGGYRPQATYRYTVDGVAHTSDRWSYVLRGVRRGIAERQLAALPDEVEVHYDPAAPADAYLETHPPRAGYALVAGGVIGLIAGLAALLG